MTVPRTRRSLAVYRQSFGVFCLLLTVACSDANTDGERATGGATTTGHVTTTGGTIATGGATSTGSTPPVEHNTGGTGPSSQTCRTNLCYVPEEAAGAAGSPKCPIATDLSLHVTLREANPQFFTSITTYSIVGGPTESADPAQCCYDMNICMIGI